MKSSDDSSLPHGCARLLTIHEAVTSRDVKATKRWLDMDPKAVVSRDSNDALPLHAFLSQLSRTFTVPSFRTKEYEETNIDIIKLLLRYDEHGCAVSTKVTSSDVMVPCALPSARAHERNHHTMSLHLAVNTGNLTIVEMIYEAYPGAVAMKNNRGMTPAELAIELWGEDEDNAVIEFLNMVSY